MTQTTSKAPNKDTEPFLEKFRRFETEPRQPAWLLPLRKAGMARFAELGFPTVQDEDWRFTNVAPLAKLPFQPAKSADDTAARAVLEKYVFAHIPGSRLVFVNGHFNTALSSVGKLPAGVKVASLATALTTDSAFIEQQLGRLARTDDNSFAALNQAFFLDGGFVHIPANQTIEEPIQFIFISAAKHNGDTIQPRNLIIAEAGGKATIIESYLAADDAAYFTNAVTEIVAGDNAALEHVKFQDEAPDAFHLATIAGNLGRTSNVNVHSFALGAKLSRNNIRTKLAGEGLECILNGLYLTRGEQLADHHMIVEHAQPHCASHEYFNGILDDKSKGVFHGRIYVHPVAQKTDAKQTNKNLLLSDDATADTKPQLEIYADDVKCTHGATIGQLNNEAIFYLRSRGLGEETARRMLIHAFAGEIIARVKHDAVREELDKVVWDRLEANPHLAAK
ncbi:MAG TPA: Fe-S cluster assembly protein SufD [Candidatus Saccharimonadales bacterium]|nr:Fe-S cluster assembly protein SufD [Candidatus Saccharimonadales bacterium]